MARTFILSLLLIFTYFSFSTSTSLETICNITPFPEFCKTILPHDDSINIYNHGRFSIQRSISTTQTFLSLINNSLKFLGALPVGATNALEDCQLLTKLNIDFFTTIYSNIQTRDSLEMLQADDLYTLFSATLTNQQTCLDGLQGINSPIIPINALLTPLFNDKMVYSVSLAIFKHCWVKNIVRGGWFGGGNPGFPIVDNDKKLRLYPGGNVVNVTEEVVVDPSGNGNFTTITQAVAAAPSNSDGSKGYFVIYVKAGVYEEYVNITQEKKYLMMIGDGINQTIISGNRSVADGVSTFNTATFILVGQGFVGVNMTIRNTAGAINHQAVALRNNADLSTFYKCSFEGYQDTLYAHSLRQFYRECNIYGTIDFIFGDAVVVLQNCNIYARLPMHGQSDPITAQGRTDINQNTGTSIQNCTITFAEELGTTKVYLGRPWQMYSRVVYMESFLGSLVDPAGWSIWSGDFALSTLYYAEFNNRGVGADTSKRVAWPGYHVINATDALNFAVANFIVGDYWLPSSGVPYFGGLLSN